MTNARVPRAIFTVPALHLQDYREVLEVQVSNHPLLPTVRLDLTDREQATDGDDYWQVSSLTGRIDIVEARMARLVVCDS
jgi:hypothetical protein